MVRGIFKFINILQNVQNGGKMGIMITSNFLLKSSQMPLWKSGRSTMSSTTISLIEYKFVKEKITLLVLVSIPNNIVEESIPAKNYQNPNFGWVVMLLSTKCLVLVFAC